MKTLFLDKISTAIGEILIIADQESLCALEFGDCQPRITAWLTKRFGPFELKPSDNPLGITDCIRGYLKSEYHCLDDIPVDTGGTAFQQQVWAALRQIPVGTVITYGQLAAQLGKPSASRAVGLANSQNPVSIVLPCHRVIGASGQLTGYAGGLSRKHWLLEHEGVQLRNQVSLNQVSQQGNQVSQLSLLD